MYPLYALNITLALIQQKMCGSHACSPCILERKGHHFSLENNMDPDIQPFLLALLTQVEEMLIYPVNLIVICPNFAKTINSCT